MYVAAAGQMMKSIFVFMKTNMRREIYIFIAPKMLIYVVMGVHKETLD
jgi:hypothetical protein